MPNPSLPHIARAFQVALGHLNAGRLNAASTACAELQRTARGNPAVLQMAATIALRRGNPADALRLIRESLAARPGHVPSLILAAQAAHAAGAHDQAVAASREAVARATALAEPAFLLCRILAEAGDPTLEPALQHAAARFGHHAGEWQALGVVLQRAGRPGFALAAFTRAASADPTLALAQFGRGLVLRDLNRMGDAQTALQQAVTLDGAAAGAWFALGLTRQDLQDDAGAAAAYEAALRERPDFAEAAVNLGIARQSLGDMDAAIAAYRRAIRLHPDSFARIAQAVTSAAHGMLWLDLGAFRRWLEA